MTTNVDMGGNTLIVEGIKVGATAPGQAGTDISGTELTFLDGAASTNAGTNKAMITGTSGALTVAGVATFAVSPVLTSGITTLAVTTLTPTTIAGTPNFTGAPTFASTSTFTGSPTFNGDPIIGVGKTLNLDSATATGSSHAATVTKYAIVYTTEALTTAGGASQAEVITLTGVAAGDLAFVTRAGGTNTTQNYALNAVTTSNTVTVTIYNNTAATALNGTIIFNLWILKA